jgi:hypothetical protein
MAHLPKARRGAMTMASIARDGASGDDGQEGEWSAC